LRKNFHGFRPPSFRLAILGKVLSVESLSSYDNIFKNLPNSRIKINVAPAAIKINFGETPSGLSLTNTTRHDKI